MARTIRTFWRRPRVVPHLLITVSHDTRRDRTREQPPATRQQFYDACETLSLQSTLMGHGNTNRGADSHALAAERGHGVRDRIASDGRRSWHHACEDGGPPSQDRPCASPAGVASGQGL